MEPYFIVQNNAEKEVVIFSRHIVSLTEGTNDGTLIDMINGVSIYVSKTRKEIITLMKESYKGESESGEINVFLDRHQKSFSKQ
jgi:hypothetical protein